MLIVRRSQDRGHFDYGWLSTFHTFSFDRYYDPNHMGFRTLRVINEDFVAPGGGFPTHPHRDMEIITYVLEGALEHRDSMGTGSVIRAGEVQRMSAGTGITHSERNASATDPVHLLQIWILPDRRGLTPGYEQKPVPRDVNALRTVASPDGREGSVTIHQDAVLYTAVLDAGATLAHNLAPKRHAWVQVARGSLSVNDQVLNQGDGAAVNAESTVTITASAAAELLLFDLS